MAVVGEPLKTIDILNEDKFKFKMTGVEGRSVISEREKYYNKKLILPQPWMS